jgi:potassium large conductance calcium-activated channel subfamily M alpha protein 1
MSEVENYLQVVGKSGICIVDANRLCFTILKLLLLAIEIKGQDGNDSKISINPRGAKIQANTQGFFIAQSADEVKRCMLYLLYLILLFLSNFTMDKVC